MENKKLFELMPQMYSDMQKGFEKLSGRLDKVEEKVDQNSKDIIRLENKLDDSTKVLFDGITQLGTQYDRVDKRVQKLEEGILEKGIVLPSEYYIQLLKKAD